jgi:hypothetical protein
MIVHIGEVWATLLAAFILGCAGGALVFIGLERSPFGAAQWAVADAIGRLGDRMRDRLGMAPVWRPKRRPARRIAVPVEPDAEGDAIWEVVDQAVEAVPPEDDDSGVLPEHASVALDEFDDALEDDALDTESRGLAGSDADIAREPPPRGLGEAPPPDGLRGARFPPRLRLAPPEARPAPPLLTGPIGNGVQAGGLEIRRPAMLAEPRNGVPDNLQRIRGIGERNEVRLNKLGIFHFSQIAAWTPAEIRWIGQRLAFAERIERDDWVGQAIVLASGGETGFIKSAERRRARRRNGRGTDENDGEPADES